MKAQGISGEPPNYIDLFTAVWPTKREGAAFRRQIRSNRRGSKD